MFLQYQLLVYDHLLVMYFLADLGCHDTICLICKFYRLHCLNWCCWYCIHVLWI